MPAKQQVTRVGVDDPTWRAFRQAALDRGLSVSSYLAKLVQAELRRRGATAVGAVGEQGSDVDIAISALLDVRAGIDALDDIAGRLARSAVAHGGSWHDVARSLGLTETAAREAYAERPARR
jgi:hypothetical protein